MLSQVVEHELCNEHSSVGKAGGSKGSEPSCCSDTYYSTNIGSGITGIFYQEKTDLMNG